MSQHILNTIMGATAAPVTVMMGWDRPLQGFFCVVEGIEDGEDEDDGYIYSNLLDEELLTLGGLASDLGMV